MEELTEKERKDTKMATLYELRLLFTQGEKEEYTKEEIVELLDKIATAKEQEQCIVRRADYLRLSALLQCAL